MLQQAIGETAGGCADVDTNLPGDVDVPMLKRALQLQSAAADVLQVLAQHANHTVSLNLRAGLFDLLLIHQHFACKDERLGALARCGQPALHKKFVQSRFQINFSFTDPTRVPAHASVQSAEASVDESVTQVLCLFSTEFSTNMLKTCGDRNAWVGKRATKKPPEFRRLRKFLRSELPGNLFQQFLVDVEIRVYVLHIIVL